MPESEHIAKDVEKVRKSIEDIVFEHLCLIFPNKYIFYERTFVFI